jgi:lipoyl(octanoyl) transferase
MNSKIIPQWLGRVTYTAALELQESLVLKKISGDKNDHLLLLEHDPVYTIGRNKDVSSLGEEKQLPHPVIRTNRGGEATYHGPGQLVGYPILDLNDHGRDLHLYLRFLEDVLIDALATYNVEGGRRDGLTGVWVEDRKIASIGVGVRRWISMHGFALNVARGLAGFSAIIPCGISGVTMTSLSIESGKDLSTQEVGEVTAEIFLKKLRNLPVGKFQSK